MIVPSGLVGPEEPVLQSLNSVTWSSAGISIYRQVTISCADNTVSCGVLIATPTIVKFSSNPTSTRSRPDHLTWQMGFGSVFA